MEVLLHANVWARIVMALCLPILFQRPQATKVLGTPKPGQLEDAGQDVRLVLILSAF